MDIMCKVNPEHKKSMHAENGGKVLYLHLLKDLYGCMESALLWYDLYSKTLKAQGFLINPYDRCIANSTHRDIKNCHVSSFMCIDNEAGEQIFQVNGRGGCVFFGYVSSMGSYICARPPF